MALHHARGAKAWAGDGCCRRLRRVRSARRRCSVHFPKDQGPARNGRVQRRSQLLAGPATRPRCSAGRSCCYSRMLRSSRAARGGNRGPYVTAPIADSNPFCNDCYRVPCGTRFARKPGECATDYPAGGGTLRRWYRSRSLVLRSTTLGALPQSADANALIREGFGAGVFSSDSRSSTASRAS